MEMVMTMKNKEIMTKTILFSALALSLIIPTAGTQVAWAHHVNYVEQWAEIDKEAEALYMNVEDLKEKINNLKKTLTPQDTKSVQMIQSLQQELDVKMQRLTGLDEELDRLEQLNIESFKVDPDTEKRFYDAQFTLLKKYVFSDSEDYIGDNPLTGVDVDFQHRKLIIKFDPNQVSEKDLARSPTKIMNDVQNLIGKTIPLGIDYATTEFIACTSRTLVCDPIKAGVQVADTTNILGNGTVMYKSTRNGNVGFVTAGHVSGPQDKIIEQPVNNRDVGAVDFRCYSGTTCDFSFVKLYPGVAISSSSIYWTSTASWVITNKIPDSSQTPTGTIIKKSGVGTGNTVGTLYENNPSLTYNKAQIVVGPMDSGSPIFRQPSDLQNAVDLWGMIFAKSGSLAYYYPWDYVKSNLGLSE